MSNPLLDAALDYLKVGLHPIPCEAKGKRPLVPWREYQDRPPTLGECIIWWSKNSDANVALVLGRGRFAVDIDGPEGERALEVAGVTLPAGAPSVTTGKGRHVYLAGVVGDRVAVLPGVDIRGIGYAIAPPSVHPSGAVYTWNRPAAYSEPLPPAPPNLLALLNVARQPAASQGGIGTSWLVEALGGVGEGQRDSTCARLAGYLWGKGIPEDAIESILQSWAEHCKPPFPAHEVTKTVVSITKREGGPAPQPMRIGELLGASVDEMLRPEARRGKVLPLGLAELDAVLCGGLELGQYAILGARPSVGKSALALQAARQRAKAGQGVLYVSREMSKLALLRRLVAQESQVRLSSLRLGVIETDIERRMLNDAVERLSGVPLWLDTESESIDQVRDAVSAFEPGALSLVVVDYLQLFRVPGVHDLRVLVESTSAGLRSLVQQQNVAVLALSSLTRPPREVSPQWRPMLVDLRDSGRLEHDADLVLLAHRPLESTVLELAIAKQKEGEVPPTPFLLTFDGAHQTITEARK